MRQDKIKAAKKLAETLVSDLDFDLWLDDHPNENSAISRLAAKLTSEGTVDKLCRHQKFKTFNKETKWQQQQ